MRTKLISITQPITEGVNTPEELIVYCARVSNPENQLNMETSPKLIKFLIKHHHWSPFEIVNFCVEIQTSRAIAAQILRHRSFSFQEFSQRYSSVTEVEPLEIRGKAEKNRQSSSEAIDPIIDNNLASKIIQKHMDDSLKLYNELIEKGVAKESARMILPLSTSTTLYMQGSVRSWIHYLQIRCAENTQKEHREIAEQIKEIFKTNFPSISEALEF